MDVAIVSSIQSSSLETHVLEFCMSMASVIGMNEGFLQFKSNSFDEVLLCMEICMFLFGLMICLVNLSSTCSISWILYWIPITCAPLVVLPMISFSIQIGRAVKITILIIGYIVLVATNFSQLRSDVSKFYVSMGLVIGMNVGFLQLKSNSFDEVLMHIEIFMFFSGLMIYTFCHVMFSPRQSRDVVSWILYWIPITCAPLVVIPMISFCIQIGGATKITILIIEYVLLVATNFSQLRSDVMRLFLHPGDFIGLKDIALPIGYLGVLYRNDGMMSWTVGVFLGVGFVLGFLIKAGVILKTDAGRNETNFVLRQVHDYLLIVVFDPLMFQPIFQPIPIKV